MVPRKFPQCPSPVTAEELQSRLLDYFADFSKCPLLRGRLLTGVALVTGGANVIRHNLGTTPVGFLVVSSSAESTFWKDSASADTIDVRCSANSTVSLWVF